MALTPEERKRGNSSPGTDATQSSDAKIENELTVAGKGKISPPRVLSAISKQPTQNNFGKILSASHTPTPVVEGDSATVIVTLEDGAYSTGLNGQFRHVFTTGSGRDVTRNVSPYRSFNISGATASFVFTCPVDINAKSVLEIRTSFNKRIIDLYRHNIISTDQLLPPAFTSTPTINNTLPIVGTTISVNAFTFSGNPTPTVAYQWSLNSSPVVGATTASYTTSATGPISVGITLTNSQGTTFTTATANAGIAPNFLVPPSASATGVTVGTTVTVNNVATSGTAPITTSYVWKLDGSIISGATSQSYATSATGGDLVSTVTATNAYGTTASDGVSFGTVGVAPSFYVGDSGPIFGDPGIGARVGDYVLIRGIYYNGVPAAGATATVTDSIGSRTVDASIQDNATLNNEGKKTEQFVIRNTSNVSIAIDIANVHGSAGVTPGSQDGTGNTYMFYNILPARAAASFLGTPSASATDVNVGTSVSINNAGATGFPVPSTVYEWTQNSSVISGATLVSYTPSATGPLSGKVTINNTSGGATSATVSFGTIAATGSSNFAPYFTGTPAGSTTNPDVGERMTFLTYGSTGLPAPVTTFQWYDDGAAISGATGYGYVLGATGEIVDAEQTFVVTANGSSNYLIDGAAQPVLALTRGVQYTFDLSDSSNGSHPFRIGTSSNSSPYTTGYTATGSQGSAGAKAVFIVPADAPATLYYYCNSHSGMGNSINVRTVPATDVTMTGNLTGVVTLTNSQGTTGATIDYGTMLNADITNLSLSNVVAGGTLTATVTYGGTFASINWTGVTS